MIERLPGEAQESSGAWNNAGTGHAANCELNYTPMRKDGSVDIAKALEVNVEFDMSRQFWSYLIRKGAIASPDSFIHPVPHMSFVIGDDRAAFLKKRHAAMSAHHCYHGMEYQPRTTSRSPNGRRWSWRAAIPTRSVAATRIVTRRRRELRRAHPQSDGLPEAAGSLRRAFLARGHRPAAPADRRRLVARRHEREDRRDAPHRRALRLPRRRRGGAARCCRSRASPRPRASPASR